jgi:hypothetical protein
MSARLQLIAPPGYGAVVPLDRQRHAGLGLPREPDYRWCGELNAVFVNAVEFLRAALDYPIAFIRDPRSREYTPVAVLGLGAAQNLFVDADGRWQAQRYVPAFVRRHPFCIAPLEPKDGSPDRLVCVQEDRLVAGAATPLFDATGEPTAAWAPVMSLLEAVENARQQTRVLAKRLEAFDLLVPFDALALPREGGHLGLTGLLRVDEQRLEALPGKDLQTLARKGELRAIYAHLGSLENFARLLDLAVAQR